MPDEDRLVVWSSTQAPECVQKVVATALGLPMHDINVKHRRAGGAFGAKATRNLPHAAAAAVAAKVRDREREGVGDVREREVMTSETASTGTGSDGQSARVWGAGDEAAGARDAGLGDRHAAHRRQARGRGRVRGR